MTRALSAALPFIAAGAFAALSAAPAQAFERDGQIVVSSGLCLDVHAPDMTTNGGRVQVWACNGQPQQRWTFDSASGVLRNAGGLCLDVHAPDLETNGGRVQVWSCNGTAQQRWVLDEARGSLIVASGRCLDVHAPEVSSNGGRVQIWACNNSAQQTWRFETATAPGAGGGAGGGQPDLTPVIGAFPSASISSGVSISIEAHNQGGAIATGTQGGGAGWMVDVILSTDTSTPAGYAAYSANYSEDVLLRGGRMSNTPDIAAGGVHRFGAPSYDVGPFGFPSDTPPGSYYLCLRIDPGNAIAESNENNNNVCQAITLTP